MNIILLGINHKKTPIDIRERFYLTSLEQELLLSELKSNPAVIEAAVFSTCNRTEVYAHVLDIVANMEDILRLVFKIKKTEYTQELKDHFYRYSGKAAVDHLLHVSAGLDSLIIGEKQIYGQIKTGFQKSRDKGMLGRNFNILANIAVRTGKKVQNETTLGIGGSSVSWAAIQKAEASLGSLEGKKACVMGAGKMGDLAINQLKGKGVEKLLVLNRSKANAEVLASRYGCDLSTFENIMEILMETDLCICSVSAPHYIIDVPMVEKVMKARKQRPLLLIDISMPRNIDPQIIAMDNVTLFAIDDLQEVVGKNMDLRKQAITEVKEIISAKLEEYYQKLEKADLFNSEFRIHESDMYPFQ